MTDAREATGFKEHLFRKGDGRGGWALRTGAYRMLNDKRFGYLMPYGVASMENGEIILIAGVLEEGHYRCVAFLSADGGESWGAPRETGAYGRPLSFGYLGEGAIVFGNELLGKPQDEARKLRLYFSFDYGKSWKEKPYPLAARDGASVVTTEGQIFGERRGSGGHTRLWHLCVHFPEEMKAGNPYSLYLRQSTDLGDTWPWEMRMDGWQVRIDYEGRLVNVGVSEGSLIRARNGTLVAAVRSDLSPRYWQEPHDDSLEGLGVSLSTDDGANWSPVRVLFEAGRHHPTLTLLADGRIVMSYIVRVDVRDGRLASYRRGCEAIVSPDHGATWDVGSRYVLDEYEYAENAIWYNGMSGHLSSALLSDGSILTCYGHYLSKGTSLVRWKPD